MRSRSSSPGRSRSRSNRRLITLGKGHAVLHNSGHQPDFPTRTIALLAGAALLFGAIVLIAEALG